MKRLVLGLLLVVTMVMAMVSLASAEGRPSWPIDLESAFGTAQ